MRKFTATSAAVIAAIGMAVGTASANPPTAPPGGNIMRADTHKEIHWDAQVVGQSVVLKTDAGTIVSKNNQLQLLDDSGAVVAGLPLSYFMDGLEYPIAAHIADNAATLTPGTDVAAARPARMPVQDVDAQTDAVVNGALADAGGKFALAVGVGSMVGSIVGLVAGCVLGVITLGTLTLPLFFPGAIGGCLAGAGAGGALGAAVGGIVVGAPVGIALALQFFQKISSPPPANAPLPVTPAH